MRFVAIIPARFASTRLPGKVLADINGRPMISHVVRQAAISGAQRVIVATDHEQVVKVAQEAGAEAILTREDHKSGTERLAEAIDVIDLHDDEIVVNVQGDEPCINPELITQVACDLSRHAAADMATLATPIQNVRDVVDPNVVKVVLDVAGNAIYFSRSIIPWDREAGGTSDTPQGVLQHIGLYAYHAGFIRQYVALERTFLEESEKLEQLRVLYHQRKIHVSITKPVENLSVDTEEDLRKVRNLMSELFA
ncbi:3-deoxy-manno-octulosonate cytidylyltransferase [Aspergillus terreus]|uniref:3-deoxy-manno-octulosonate cytidylyltransferase n=1 Tax=Aspergillus terreus TaxID=33178 RepID=A0A5M3Z4C3_ASPTE|nr:hypothetical protein ATETN484_0007000200 [Aspergillus terreus]GFF19343.1 3-deoxy-manno-octulosonate cytidylyltransferase [Aspergillus terreus]